MGYDANGNMTYKLKGGQADVYIWDAENRLTQVKRNGAVLESYLYDADGQRVKKIVGATSTFFISPLFEKSGATTTKYYYFNGQRVAMRINGVLQYLHADHLGSTVLTTNAASGSAIIGDEGYLAYGRNRRGNGVPTDFKFTGQKQDGSGLQYFNARYFDPQVGVFISPDTIVPDTSNVFDYQRYAYARLNPLKFNDPTGHVATCTMDAKGNMQCGDVTVGIQTVTSAVDPLAPPCLSNCPKTVDQIIRETLAQLQNIENPFSVTYDEDGMPSISIDQSQLSDALTTPLQTCASLIGGVCGFSISYSSNGGGAGARAGGSIYVDQSGNTGVFIDVGGGAYSPWPAPISKYTVTGIQGAKIQDMDGMSAQIGASGAIGPTGMATEGILMKSDDGKFLQGQSSGFAYTAAAAGEGHFTFVYSYPLVYINANE